MTCGDYGGVTLKGEPCKRSVGWGVPGTNEGRCKDHLAQEPVAPKPEPPPTEFYAPYEVTVSGARSPVGVSYFMVVSTAPHRES